jgi:type IV secretory pathway protease TraF
MWTAPEVNGRLPRLLKHVAAIPGDRVCWDADGMTVGTSRGTVTYPYHSEKIEFRRPTDCLIVPPGFLILVGTHPRSFDSRYIGAVSGHLLQMRVIPLWTWEAA